MKVRDQETNEAKKEFKKDDVRKEKEVGNSK